MTAAYVALEGGHVLEGVVVLRNSTRRTGFHDGVYGIRGEPDGPSYEEQVLTFSYPLIGNYGVREERFEDDRVHPRAVLAKELTADVVDWLDSEGVPAIDHLDTREVVTDIRDGGAMKCGIAVGEDVTQEDALDELAACKSMSEHTDIGTQVSVDEPIVHGADNDGPDVALVDCGAKGSIVDSLLDRDATVHVLPYDVAAADVDALDPDVLFISNGPGDPANYEDAISLVQAFVEDARCRHLPRPADRRRSARRDDYEDDVRSPRRQPARPRPRVGSGRDDDPEPRLHGRRSGRPPRDHPGKRQRRHARGTRRNPTRHHHPSVPPEANPGPEDTLDFFDDVLAMAETHATTAVPADD